MGWSTELYTSITYNRKTYNTKFQVESDLEEARDAAQRVRERIMQLAAITDPAKYMPEDWSDPLEWLNHALDEALEALEDATIDIWKLEYLLQEWDNCHLPDGSARPMPQGLSMTDSYIWGDFIDVKSIDDLKADSPKTL